MITDQVTDLNGMLTILSIDSANNIHYLFQPAGLSPKTKEPLNTFWITKQRVFGAEIKEVDLPVEVLATEVEDKASGFKGTAISLYYHLNGCIHFEVKPKGVIEETGESIKSREFDMRRLKGIAIKELTEEEHEASKNSSPSPEFCPPLDVR